MVLRFWGVVSLPLVYLFIFIWAVVCLMMMMMINGWMY